MIQRKRWLVAFAALGIGGAVSATLLVLANPARDSVDVYVAARDLPAGASLGADAVAIERMAVASRQSLFFGRGDASRACRDARFSRPRVGSADPTQRRDGCRLGRRPPSRVRAGEGRARRGRRVQGRPAGRRRDSRSPDGDPVRARRRGALDHARTGSPSSSPRGRLLPSSYAANAMRLVAVIAEPGTADGVGEPGLEHERGDGCGRAELSRVIAIAGAKGSPGCSFLAVALARRLAEGQHLNSACRRRRRGRRDCGGAGPRAGHRARRFGRRPAHAGQPEPVVCGDWPGARRGVQLLSVADRRADATPGGDRRPWPQRGGDAASAVGRGRLAPVGGRA